MKKRLLVLFLAIVSCIALAFGLTACNRNNDKPSGENQGGTTQPPATHTHVMTHHEKVEADCTTAGNVEYWSCSGCGKNFADEKGARELTTITVKATGHSFSTEWTYNETHHWHAATCGHTGETKDKAEHRYNDDRVCTCGKKDTALHGVELKAEDFERDGLTLYKEVSSDTETFSFRTGIEVAEGAIYRIYSDLNCKHEIASKTDDLAAGDNIFYLLVTNGNDLEIYTVTIRRIPVYTVSFITDGSAIEPQYIEEGKLAQQPTQAVTRTGYTFVSWDYDFNKPVTDDITVTALWKANDYIITFDVNGGDNLQSNTQTVTYNGDYMLPVPTRTGYTFEGWYVDETKLWDDLSWHIASNVAATAKWKADIYRVAVSCGSNGSVTGSGNYEYNSTVTLTATPYLGYSLVGWYEGEQLVCSENTYSVTVPDGDVSLTVRFQVVESMQGFEFTSTQTSCTITGLKDKNIIIPVTIPDFVTGIGDYAFSGCNRLTSVTIGNDVTSIGNRAFENCSWLIEVFNKSALPIIAGSSDYGYVAYYAKNVYTQEGGSKLEINNGFVIYEGTLLHYVGNQPEITIPDGVISIGSGAFQGCGGLTGGLVISDSVTTIGDHAFAYCSGLTSVTIGRRVAIIGDNAFDGCLWLIEVFNKSALPIVAGSSDCGGVAYYARNVYTQEGGSKIEIDNNGFAIYDENALVYYRGTQTEIIIPDGVTSIGSYAFYRCNGLTSVTIPESVASIWSGAFYGCDGLTTVYWNAIDCSYAGSLSFMEHISCYEIYVETPIFGYGTNIKNVIFGNHVQTIPSVSFYGCSGLTSVAISDGVTSIESGAFWGCSGLTSVTIPESVTSIGYSAFWGCSGLTSVTIPESVTSIGCSAFWGCSGLTSVTIGSNVTSIGKGAFTNCGSLTNVTIPNSVTSIGSFAFDGCSGLTSVTFENADGWSVSKNSDMSDATALSASNLSVSVTAASYLKSTYYNYFWKRS